MCFDLAKYWTRIYDIPELLIFVILTILWATKLQIEGFFFTKRVWNHLVLAYDGTCDVIPFVWQLCRQNDILKKKPAVGNLQHFLCPCALR